MIFPLHAVLEPTLPRWLSAGWKGQGNGRETVGKRQGNKPGPSAVTGEHSTTEALMPTSFILLDSHD